MIKTISTRFPSNKDTKVKTSYNMLVVLAVGMTPVISGCLSPRLLCVLRLDVEVPEQHVDALLFIFDRFGLLVTSDNLVIETFKGCHDPGHISLVYL